MRAPFVASEPAGRRAPIAKERARGCLAAGYKGYNVACSHVLRSSAARYRAIGEVSGDGWRERAAEVSQ